MPTYQPSTTEVCPVFCPQVQVEELQVSREKAADDGTEQEPWIGVVPVEMDDSKSSTWNQESFADAVVNKVSGLNQILVVTCLILLTSTVVVHR